MKFDRLWAENVSDFDSELNASKGIIPSCDVREILCSRIPGCVRADPADVETDKTGVDWVVTLECGREVGVDVKRRKKDFMAFGNDDLALETWSVIGKRPGWTRDAAKACEIVLWVWEDTGRFCMIPFLPLCKSFQDNWQEWVRLYGPQRQETKRDGDRWSSECVFVPRDVVITSVLDILNGTLA